MALNAYSYELFSHFPRKDYFAGLYRTCRDAKRRDVKCEHFTDFSGSALYLRVNRRDCMARILSKASSVASIGVTGHRHYFNSVLVRTYDERQLDHRRV